MRGKRGWAGVVSGDIRIHSIGSYGGKLKQSHTLMPGELAIARVKPRLTTQIGRVPQITTRSILARHGIEVGFGQGQVSEILSKAQTPKTVFMRHSGVIPLRLRRGNRTHRIFFNPLGEPLRGREIYKLKRNRSLVLGKDISVRDDGLLEIKVQNVVYELKKNPKEVARKNWVSGSKRKEFMKNFRRSKRPVTVRVGQVTLTETKPVKLPKDVGLFLQATTERGSVHIRSLFIDPGFEGPIVLELFGLREGARPDNILGWLVRQ